MAELISTFKPTKKATVSPKKRSVTRHIGHGIIYIVLSACAFIWVYPFIWMVSASFKTQDEFFSNGLSVISQHPTFANFIRAWKNANFSQYFMNTVIVTVSTVIIVLACSSAAGYVVGRYHFPGKNAIMGIFMASITIPLVSTVIPIYEILKSMGLSQSLLGLILAQCGGGHILFVLLFAGFFAQIPNELEEAAIIDGCGFFGVFSRIMFPVAKPIISTVITMQFIWSWNDFLLPLVLTLSKPSIRTLAVGMYALKGEHVVDWTGIAAAGSIAVIPIIVLFIFLQKYFVNGIAGAVKS